MYLFDLLAHASRSVSHQSWWLAWNFDPFIITSLLLLTGLYAYGLRQISCLASRPAIVSKLRRSAFFCGMVALAVALLSPLDTISDDLSWVHMLQHMTLTTVASPMVMSGLPGLVTLWAMPLRWRKRWGKLWSGPGPWPLAYLHRALWNPALVWLLYALALWLWHVPVFYEAALKNQLVHDLEHLTFFVASCAYWRLLLDSRRNRMLTPGVALVYLFTTSIHSMFLGVFMTLAPQPWYAYYHGRTSHWGLTALEDQQLAGAIMWMPAGMAFTLTGITAIFNLLTLEDTRPVIPSNGSSVSPIIDR